MRESPFESFLKIPYELQVLIASFLDEKTLKNLKASSTLGRNIANSVLENTYKKIILEKITKNPNLTHQLNDGTQAQLTYREYLFAHWEDYKKKSDEVEKTLATTLPTYYTSDNKEEDFKLIKARLQLMKELIINGYDVLFDKVLNETKFEDIDGTFFEILFDSPESLPHPHSASYEKYQEWLFSEILGMMEQTSNQFPISELYEKINGYLKPKTLDALIILSKNNPSIHDFLTKVNNEEYTAAYNTLSTLTPEQLKQISPFSDAKVFVACLEIDNLRKKLPRDIRKLIEELLNTIQIREQNKVIYNALCTSTPEQIEKFLLTSDNQVLTACLEIDNLRKELPEITRNLIQELLIYKALCIFTPEQVEQLFLASDDNKVFTKCLEIDNLRKELPENIRNSIQNLLNKKQINEKEFSEKDISELANYRSKMYSPSNSPVASDDEFNSLAAFEDGFEKNETGKDKEKDEQQITFNK